MSENSSLQMEDSNFYNNSAHQAGAIQIQNNSTATISSCTFIQNSADVGAVIAAFQNASVQMKNCTLKANTATQNVILANGQVTLNVSHSQLIGNECKKWTNFCQL